MSRRPVTSSQLRARSRRQWIGRGEATTGDWTLRELRPRGFARASALDQTPAWVGASPGPPVWCRAGCARRWRHGVSRGRPAQRCARSHRGAGAARRPRSDRTRRRAQARRGSMQRKPCLVPRIDRLSSRNNSDPLAATTHHLDSGSSRRRATNNIRQAAPALPQRQQRRSWRQLLRQRPRRVRGLARRRQCRRVRRQRSHPQPDLAPGVGVVVAAPSRLVAVPWGQAALPLAAAAPEVRAWPPLALLPCSS
jgi:hypothetical protein